MALPKEPRQKMINIMYLVLTAILALNVSAEVINAFKTVNTSLLNSNTNITAANKTLYSSLQRKLTDPTSAEQAKIWEPKAEMAHKLSDDITGYIDNLKDQLIKGSNYRVVDGKPDYKVDD